MNMHLQKARVNKKKIVLNRDFSKLFVGESAQNFFLWENKLSETAGTNSTNCKDP